MSTLIPGANRSLLINMRADLIVREQSYLGRKYRVVKDPLGLKYYRFEEEEFSILEMLDGKTSLNQLKRRFEKRFAPQRISRQELHRLIGMLYQSSLVVSTAPGQGAELLKRRNEKTTKERKSALTNILCIRFKGIDPDALLSRMTPWLRWLFTVPAAWMIGAFALSALVLIGVHFEEFQHRLPEFQQFFAFKNWIWLALVLGITKVLHEFGHGIACKRFGGECHEMGVMFLVLTPCLYCNVSDSWMLPNKWHRAAIGAAGMYIEIFLASICTYLWWFSQAGMLNYLCLNIMFVCSVSTILFNANPLMRYDGYYILSDIAEIPNLRQKASTILNRKMSKWFLGLPETDDPFLPKQNQALFGFYCIAAGIYRWVISLSIMWFLYQVFEPYGLKIVGQAIAAMSLFSLIVMPLWQLAKFFYVPGRFEQVNKTRLMLSAGGAVAGLALLLFVPLPYQVSCNLQIQPRDAASVYVDVPGGLRKIEAQPGQIVSVAETLVQLDDSDSELLLASMRGQYQEMNSRLDSLRNRKLRGDESASMEYANLAKKITSLKRELADLERDVERLTIKSPIAGTVISAEPIYKSEVDGQLRFWSGTPLQRKNVGAYMPGGVLVCKVGNPKKLDAVLVIDQADIDGIQIGQDVEFVLAQSPWRTFAGTIEHISERDMEETPAHMTEKGGGDLMTYVDQAGDERTVTTMYQANVPIELADATVLINANGQAKIHAGYRTLGSRIYQFICKTFRFDLA
ncbi:MAG: putative peptide zinc metalloprotease protein [Pirellulaceae bacterium]|jgi:putative peptide zinc metalloprotease protein